MLKTCNLSKKSFFYYDIENLTIARFPSKSNLKTKGSDNSLYFGMKNNDDAKSVFCDFFNVKTIEKINGLNFDMKCGYETVNVIVNINAEGQIQIKIMKDGTMNRLASNNSFDNMISLNYTQMLLVIDFKNKEIRFKNPIELYL